jgi:LysM repeat protein
VTRAAWLGLVLALATAPNEGRAAEQRYVLGAGEALETVAARAYGNAELAGWVAAVSGLSGPARPGDEIRLPGADRYLAVEGDTWDALAERSLGSAALADDLARLNGRTPGEPIEPGEQLRLPAVASYRILPGDSLARVSRRFYATPELAPLLARMNGLANAGHIIVGRTIRVPIPHVVDLEQAAASDEPLEPEPRAELPESTPPPVEEPDPTMPPALASAEPVPPVDPAPSRPAATHASAATPAKRAEPAPRPVGRPKPAVEVEPVAVAPVSSPPPERPALEFADALRSAGNAYLDGRYDTALASLERLRAEVLARGTPAEQSTLLRQLAFVYVAYDRSADACAAWRALLRVDGDTALDPNLVSPKIRDAVADCR